MQCECINSLSVFPSSSASSVSRSTLSWIQILKILSSMYSRPQQAGFQRDKTSRRLLICLRWLFTHTHKCSHTDTHTHRFWTRKQRRRGRINQKRRIEKGRRIGSCFLAEPLLASSIYYYRKPSMSACVSRHLAYWGSVLVGDLAHFKTASSTTQVLCFDLKYLCVRCV